LRDETDAAFAEAQGYCILHHITAARARRRRLRNTSTPLAQDLGSSADRPIRPRPGALRFCHPHRRAMAAAGSGRMPNAPGSSTWAQWGGDAEDDVLGGAA
jgi:hypothetical protein